MQLSVQHLAEVVETIRKAESGGSNMDKRRFARITLVTRVEVFNPAAGRVYTALTRDLSLEGIGLLQSVTMQAGQQITLSLPRGAKQGPLNAECRVMHVRELAEGVWGIGAHFVSVREPAKNTADVKREAKRISDSMLE